MSVLLYSNFFLYEIWVSHMFIFLQMNANDPSILSGYLQKSMDRGKTWSKRWFVVTKEFAMYEFKAHHVSICIWILQQCWRVHKLVLKVLFSVYTDTHARFNRLESVTEVCHCIFFFLFPPKQDIYAIATLPLPGYQVIFPVDNIENVFCLSHQQKLPPTYLQSECTASRDR